MIENLLNMGEGACLSYKDEPAIDVVKRIQERWLACGSRVLELPPDFREAPDAIYTKHWLSAGNGQPPECHVAKKGVLETTVLEDISTEQEFQALQVQNAYSEHRAVMVLGEDGEEIPCVDFFAPPDCTLDGGRGRGRQPRLSVSEPHLHVDQVVSHLLGTHKCKTFWDDGSQIHITTRDRCTQRGSACYVRTH